MLPYTAAAAINQRFGEAGQIWMNDLPRRVAYCAETWSLDLGEAIPSSAAAIVHARDANHNPVTLKLLVSASDYACECAALRAFGGRGAVQVVAESPAVSALLLERAVPGEALSTFVAAGQDDLANQVAAHVMLRLSRTPPSRSLLDEFTHVGTEARAALERYVSTFGGSTTGPISGRVIDQAASLIKEMRQSEDEVVILHADLHHDNLLRAEREPWLAIDPKGRLGEPAAELAAFIRNPIDHLRTVSDLRRVLHRRIDQLVEILGYDRDRVTSWGIGLATVAACWQFEDREIGWDQWLRVAEAMQ